MVTPINWTETTPLSATNLDQMEKNMLDTTDGHTHNGVDSKIFTIGSGAVGADALASTASYNAAITRYYSISPSHFVGETSAEPWFNYVRWLQSSSMTASFDAFAGINLPHGSIVTSFKGFWYRNDVLASGLLRLYKTDFSGGSSVTMASADSNSSSGNHTVEDTTITDATINNTLYSYSVGTTIDPNDSYGDVYLYGCLITYTINLPLP